MSAQEFILIPKENYIKTQPKALEVLDDPTSSEKADQLTMLQRIPQTKGDKEPSIEPKQSEVNDSVQKRILRSITMLKPHQTEKSKGDLGEIAKYSGNYY